MISFAIYRLPDTDTCVRICSDSMPQHLSSYAELEDKSGFVFAPFCLDDDSLLVIQPDKIETKRCDEMQCTDEVTVLNVSSDRDAYRKDFECFHSKLLDGRFDKLVLSRNICVDACVEKEAMSLFVKACRMYPHQFIALVSTPVSGTWLMSTPEVLIEKCSDSSKWHTMALAGTMKTPGPWSDKNEKEQQYVADYINKCLTKFSDDIEVSAPHTTTAANLFHLRTDFYFSMRDDKALGRMIDELHPTPAVCGIPKEAARAFILSNEHSKRHYYSGFCGPLNYSGTTHLYVSLRCMQIEGKRCRLYAGGGLLTDSEEAHEWLETECKLNTMLDVLR
jgi:isochorismate synthase